MIRKFQFQGYPICVPAYQKGGMNLDQAYYPQLCLKVGQVVPVSATLPRSNVALVTGPNHSGKTSFLKSVAQCVLFSHLGMMVPAAAFTTPVYHQMMTLFSAGEENGSNQSRYELELAILRKMHERSDDATLLLYNEPLTSTNPEEAVSILSDSLCRLAQRGCTQLVVTHFYDVYDQLIGKLSDQLSSYVTDAEIDHGQIHYGYRIRPAVPNPQHYAHMIAQKYGLTAESILKDESLIALIHAYLNAG